MLGIIIILVLFNSDIIQVISETEVNERIYSLYNTIKDYGSMNTLAALEENLNQNKLQESMIKNVKHNPILHKTAEELISRDDLDIKTRLQIAKRITEESWNDLAIIYLISFEIAKSLNKE